MIGLFSDSPDVLDYGVRQARVESLFYCMLALAHCIAGVMRGAGKATVPMFTMLGFWCVLRVTYITAALHFYPQIEVVFSAYPLTWCTSCIVFLLYFFKADWMHNFERKYEKKENLSFIRKNVRRTGSLWAGILLSEC